ncbi:MAG TPA: hypothetical protein VND87_10355 [Stellaceae bacterium]|nr:hypothetical protein [Stellaceae bacterium]
MTLTEAGEIFAHWAESPPTHLMLQTIAAMLGWKPHQPGERVGSLADLAAAPPPGLAVSRGPGPAMPAPVFDIAALRAANRERAAALAGGPRSQPKE